MVGCARGGGGGGLVFYRYFSCSHPSARGYLLLGLAGVLELATKLRLFDETMQHGRVVGVPLVQELDRHVAAEVFIVALVDHTNTALAELAMHDIFAGPLREVVIRCQRLQHRRLARLVNLAEIHRRRLPRDLADLLQNARGW